MAFNFPSRTAQHPNSGSTGGFYPSDGPPHPYAQPACGYADHEPADEEEVVARVVGEEGERGVDDVAADVGDAGGERDGADGAEPVGQEAEERREEQLGRNSIDILGTSLNLSLGVGMGIPLRILQYY